MQCNDAPVKVCRYPVTGLCEGRAYAFRVRAVNSAGVSRPSRVSDAVAALDPVDLRRLQGRSPGGRGAALKNIVAGRGGRPRREPLGLAAPGLHPGCVSWASPRSSPKGSYVGAEPAFPKPTDGVISTHEDI